MGEKIWLVTAKFSYLAFLLSAIPENRKQKWTVFLLARNPRSIQIIESLSFR
jgi:hypothetical protein